MRLPCLQIFTVGERRVELNWGGIWVQSWWLQGGVWRGKRRAGSCGKMSKLSGERDIHTYNIYMQEEQTARGRYADGKRERDEAREMGKEERGGELDRGGIWGSGLVAARG